MVIEVFADGALGLFLCCCWFGCLFLGQYDLFVVLGDETRLYLAFEI